MTPEQNSPDTPRSSTTEAMPPTTPSRKRRWWLRIFVGFAGLLLVLLIAAIVVLRSARFQDYVRTRIIQVAEKATGARVEIGAIHVDWASLQAGVDKLVLHGKENASEPPLVMVDSATLGLRVISVMERTVDLASLRVDKPQVHVIVYADGSTNFPGPAARSDKLWSEELLNLKVGKYEILNGSMEYDNRRTPLNLRGEDLRVRMNYEAQGPAYRGDLSSNGLRVDLPPLAGMPEQPITGSVNTDFLLERNRVSFQHMMLRTDQDTAVQLSGTLDDLRAPHGTLQMQATTPLREVVRRFSLPIDPVGTATLNGQLVVGFGDPTQFGVKGRLVASGLRYVQGRVKIENARLEGDAEISRDGLILRRMKTRVFDADVTGEGHLDHWTELHIAGNLAGLDLQKAASTLTPQPVLWSGTMGGTFTVDTTLRQTNTVTRMNLSITPGSNPATATSHPIQGHVDAVYDEAAGTLALGSSSIETAASRVEVSGTLGRELRIRLRSTNLDELLPVIDLVSPSKSSGTNTATAFPLKLNNGSIAVDGTITGAFEDPHFAGQMTLANGQIRGYSFERFAAEVSADRQTLLARNINGARGATELTGSAALTVRPAQASNATTAPATSPFSGFEDAEMTGQLNVRNIRVAELIKELGNAPQETTDVSGLASAAIKVSGSVSRPEFSLAVDVANPVVYGERFNRLRANVRYSPGILEVNDGIAGDQTSEVTFTGRYQHETSNWKTGDITFDAVTEDLPSTRIEHLNGWKMPFSSVFNGRLRAQGKVANGTFTLSSATADISAREIRVDNQPIGDFTILAETQGTTLTVNAGGNIRESLVEGSGTWKLEGDAPGSATVRFTRLTAASAHALAMLGVPINKQVRELPVDGFIEGGGSINVPLQNLGAFKAEATLTAVQLNGRDNQALSLGVQPADLVLRNSQPVVLDITANEARLRQAQFTGRDTNLTASGVIPFRDGAGADLTVRGNANLVILQLFYADLVAQGNATVDTSIRGNLQDPTINGKLTLTDARLEMKDFPNGVDHAQGSIAFDRRRATIESLTAQTGGGTIAFSGFMEFGSSVVYRLQASIRQVRVRYPQDIYTTFSGNLAFNGSPDSSTLSGTVTLTRSTLTPRADLGQLIAQLSETSTATESTNAYLRGLQLDIRIESAPGFQMETSLTRDLEADVSLRLRGSPVRPVLLGSVSIDRGEVQVFGNRYTVDRGDIRFLNPVKIEPTFDMSLSTRARGVTVNVSFTGTMSHLNPNYSSDPPLQSSEIFALLAVDRDPTQTANQLAPGTPSSGTSSFVETGGSILGQALSAQVSNKVQRFLGTSRVKIDPTLTGVDNLPQARLTLEQQVSKEVTLTYITNLNRSSEQIVRIQWDLSREWSAIFVRDQNGMFGMDFQFRKRFN